MIPSFLANVPITSILKWTAVAAASAFIFYSGYNFGSSGKKEIQQELDKILVSSKAQQKLIDNAKSTLEFEVAKVESRFSEQLATLTSSNQSLQRKWEKEVSDSKAKVLSAESRLNSANASVKEVEGLLAKALLGGSPEEIRVLQSELKKRSLELEQALSRKEGLVCMGTTIPEEFVRMFNSSGVLP